MLFLATTSVLQAVLSSLTCVKRKLNSRHSVIPLNIFLEKYPPVHYSETRCGKKFIDFPKMSTIQFVTLMLL